MGEAEAEALRPIVVRNRQGVNLQDHGCCFPEIGVKVIVRSSLCSEVCIVCVCLHVFVHVCV